MKAERKSVVRAGVRAAFVVQHVDNVDQRVEKRLDDLEDFVDGHGSHSLFLVSENIVALYASVYKREDEFLKKFKYM